MKTTTTTTIKWSDQMGHRDRKAGLLIISDGRPYWFVGGSDRHVRVLSATWQKDGKWSHTTYEIELAPGVRAYPAHQGWESGKWREGLAAAISLPANAGWQAIADRLGVPLSSLVDEAAGKVVIPRGPEAAASEVD